MKKTRITPAMREAAAEDARKLIVDPKTPAQTVMRLKTALENFENGVVAKAPPATQAQTNPKRATNLDKNVRREVVAEMGKRQLRKLDRSIQRKKKALVQAASVPILGTAKPGRAS